MRHPFGQSMHLIAEIGVAHEGSLTRAKSLIRSASAAGAHSVKLQFYKSELLASRDALSYWNSEHEPTDRQSDLFSKYDKFDLEDYRTLAHFAHKCGVDFGLSVFHLGAATEVSSFVDYFKIASGDLTFYQLHKEISDIGLPIVISTGASTSDEIELAYHQLKYKGSTLVFLQCTLAYPTQVADANISSVRTLQEIVPSALVGTSDHISDGSVLRFQLALAAGATVFEKHFSDIPGSRTNDHYHSWGASGFENLSSALQEAQSQLGSGELLLKSEIPARVGARRSAYFAKSLREGTVLSESAIVFLRPGGGLSPIETQSFLGKTLASPVSEGDRVDPHLFVSDTPQ